MYIFIWASQVALVVKSSLPKQEMEETGIQSLGWKDTLEEEMGIHSSILAGESHRQRGLVGNSPWGHKKSDLTKAT